MTNRTPKQKRSLLERIALRNQSLTKTAKFGDLHAPAYIQTEIEDTERQIEELKAKLS